MMTQFSPIEGSKSRPAGRILAVLMAGALMLSSLVAAPGQTKGNGAKGSATTSGKCSVTPNPAMNGRETFTVSGSGLSTGITLDILVGGGMFLFAPTDSSGNFTATAWTSFSQTGTQSVKVYRMGDRRETLLASCSFVVN